MPTETEFKFAVDDPSAFDSLIRQLDLPTRDFHTSTIQVNNYFDTPSFALHAQHVALRLREESGSYMLTLKGGEERRTDNGVATERTEVEVRLSPDLALDVLQGSAAPREVLATRIAERHPKALAMLDEARAGADLRFVGSFENRRTRLKAVPVLIGEQEVELVFELDSSRFGPNVEEHEIEVEIPEQIAKSTDLESIHDALTSILSDAGIEWRPAASKAQRFFALLRESS